MVGLAWRSPGLTKKAHKIVATTTLNCFEPLVIAASLGGLRTANPLSLNSKYGFAQ
jgi:hypothetical protein